MTNHYQYSSHQSEVDANIRLERATMFLGSEQRRILLNRDGQTHLDDISVTSRIGLQRMIEGRARELISIIAS